MKILVTNDDGILSEGIWALVKQLKEIGQVVVVAPDREQSAIGTAVTLRQPLRIQKVEPEVPGVEAYSVQGTPSDSVILALGKLVHDKIDFVVSGINRGLNLGDDVLISGTVGAALQGYLRGFPAMAVSAPRENRHVLDTAARVAALLVKKVIGLTLPVNIFLNVNMPDLLPSARIKGARITRLADESHINTVEETDDGQEKLYELVRQRVNRTPGGTTDGETDVAVVEQGKISITPLYFKHYKKPPLSILKNLCSGLMQELDSGYKEPSSAKL